MTTIAAALDPLTERIVIAADRQITYGYVTTQTGTKIVKRELPSGKFLVAGVSGPAASINVLRHGMGDLTELRGDAERYLYDHWVPQWFKAHEAIGRRQRDNEVDSVPATVLIGLASRLFVVTSSDIVEWERYTAIGTGSEFAIGAMSVLYGEREAADVVMLGMAAAMKYDRNTGGTIAMETT